MLGLTWLSLPTAAAGAAGAAAITDTVTVLCVVIVTVCVDACVVTPVFSTHCLLTATEQWRFIEL